MDTVRQTEEARVRQNSSERDAHDVTPKINTSHSVISYIKNNMVYGVRKSGRQLNQCNSNLGTNYYFS